MLLFALQAWSLLALFVTMVSGLVLGPLPTGAWAFMGATFGLTAHILTFPDMFAAANNTVVWLVLVSFFLAKVGDWKLNQCLTAAIQLAE